MTFVNFFASIFPTEFLELPIIDISETIIVFTPIRTEMRCTIFRIDIDNGL